MFTQSSAHNSKIAHDHDRAFRIRTRGVKAAGLWAAGQMGLSGDAAQDYARALVLADFEEVGDEDVIAKLRQDLSGVGITEAELRVLLTHCLADAERSLGS
ncbi:hypothetical protein A6A04_12010 [Paramagnetospirillum marisnigri]|uniref:Aldolase n=1 Tax=Paramagnetospirillum marisnigri TaxID=1285242 RepID=A0A178MY07_9PROT|nr:DUF1476 domain-containing protein [Paramagnetospirillum marisnigri]OAN54642.1 hypothetical protein A6A04_12010 [Paramagnetospirillum marisnigri]